MYLSSLRIYLTLCFIAFLHGQVMTQSNCHVSVNASKSIICPNENVELSAASSVDSIWNNIYQTPGESANGHFGFETVLSDNGLILAVGEPVSSINGANSGRVRTFKKIFTENNEYWLEIGQLIGEAGELCGWSIDLSSDGLTMVVGCPGIFSDIGKVKVYKLIGDQWILKGPVIESNFTGGCFSRSVSINGNGNLIAFGGDCSPMVYTYMFQNNVWSLLGNPISVRGRSIELDSLGSRLVIGTECSTECLEYVKVYDFIGNQWLETHEFNYASNQFSGPVVDVNSSGKIISIAYLFSSNSNGNNNGLVRIFEEVEGVWQQLGSDIIGENVEALGSAICLSNDGKKIALGSRYLINEGGNTDFRGKVATYIFDNSNWNLYGGIIFGDFPSDGNGWQPLKMTLVPTLSGDGKSLAVGIPGSDFNGTNSGLVKIYTLKVPETQYYWSNGETTSSIFVSPTETTTYSVIVTQGNQTCTNEVTINVNQPSAENETITACNSYTWNDNTYTQTGTYTWTDTNAAGCDSTVTLDLTILNETESVIEIFACEDYFWNDSLYTRSGTYTIVNNCASQTLILHLNEPQEIYEFIAFGSSYIFNGEALSSSGVFYDTIPRAGLCDSVIRLNLFVNNDIACNINYEIPNSCIVNSLELSTTIIKPKIYTIKTEIKDYEWFSTSILFSVLAEGAPEQGIQAGILFSNELNPNWQNRIANPEWWGYNGKFFVPLNTDSLNLDYTDTYYYRAYLIHGGDTILAQNTQQFRFFNGDQFNQTLDYGIISDVNGNNYKTINIGSQKWMAEDLITNLFSNGDSLYNSITQYFPESGNGLYSHAIVDDERNVCPLGMHVPNDSDWSTLFQSTLNNDNLNKTSALLSNVYEIDSIWPVYNPKLNSTGLAILLENNFASYYWSSTFDYSFTDASDNVYNFYRSTLIGRNDATVGFGQNFPTALHRIRCVSNESISSNQFPTIFSTQVSDITNNSVKVGVELLNPNNAELIDKGIIVSTYTSLNGLSFGILPSTDDTPFPLLDDFKVFKLFSDSDGVNLNIENLLPNMKYYVRAYVKNRFGVIYGEELSFTTLNNSILWSTGETTPSITVSPTETTTYSVTVTQANQTCTSEVTLTVNQPTSETVNATITEGESYSFNGQSLTTAGTYTAALQNAAGCDSTVTLNLSVVPQPLAGCYAATVIDFAQGLNSVGLPVEPARSHAIFSLGAPEAVVDGIVNFVSLGFGGSITLAFEAPIANGNGADIRIDEATWGNNPCNRYPESADVFASQDGINFVYLGRGCQDMSLDLGSLSWAQYIRITDVSDILSFRAGSDGYDVNGIECLNGTANTTGDDGLVGCSLQEVVSYTPGNRKNGTPVVTSRSNPANALGLPQNNNTINFTALGFGGTIVAKFDYVVFNQPGNDLRITETSFGNPNCANYPEKARISMSLDNLNWVDLGEICQDGEVDLGALPYAQYIKIQDSSPLTSTRFSGTADGFDVDAVVLLNNGCVASAARSADEDNTTSADETPVMEAYPNPMEDETSIRFVNVQTEADIRIELFDAAGRIVLNQNARIDVEQNVVIIPTSNLAKGMYHLVVNTGNDSFRERLVK